MALPVFRFYRARLAIVWTALLDVGISLGFEWLFFDSRLGISVHAGYYDAWVESFNLGLSRSQ